MTAAEEWKRGWRIVFACFVGMSFGGVAPYATGAFMDPLMEEFSWTRTLVSSSALTGSVMVGLLSPFAGSLADRYGSRRIALTSLLGTIISASLIGLANGSPTQWVLLWVLYATCAAFMNTTIWTLPVVNAFKAGQGLALGIMLSGIAVAQIVVPPLTIWLIDEVGWRMAYVCLGLGWGAISFPICYLFLPKHIPVSAVADGRTSEHGGTEASGLPPGLTKQEAWRDPALRKLAVSSFLIMVFTLGLLVHQIPILVESGLSRTDAAWMASLAGVAAITGKLVTGVLLDKYPANHVGGLTLGFNALGFLLLVNASPSIAVIIAAMAISGYVFGGKLQITSYLTAQYGGVRNYGAIYGFMTSIITFGAGLGPMLAGLAYDLSGSYAIFLVAGAVGSVVCGLLIIALPRRLQPV